MRKIEFEFDTQYGVYRDSIFVSDTATTEQIQEAKEIQLAKWLLLLSSPPKEED